MKRTTSSPELSRDIVEFLRRQGRTLREIGAMASLSESFVSRVARGERTFTLEHLDRFEAALKQPLPALIMEAMWKDRIAPHNQPMFEQTLAMVRQLCAERFEMFPPAEVLALRDRRRAGKSRAKKRQAS